MFSCGLGWLCFKFPIFCTNFQVGRLLVCRWDRVIHDTIWQVYRSIYFFDEAPWNTLQAAYADRCTSISGHLVSTSRRNFDNYAAVNAENISDVNPEYLHI